MPHSSPLHYDPKEYRLFLRTIQGGVVRTLIEVLKEIVHDVSLVFDSEGIKLVTMDGARCALIHLRLHATAFEEYHCQGTFEAGINMASLFKLVRGTGSHDTITMYATTSSINELGIRVANTEKAAVTEYSLKLLDVDSENIKIPDVVFDSIITLPSAYLQRLCRDMINIADTMSIVSVGTNLTLSCEGDFARQETYIGEADDGMTVATSSDVRVQGRFSLKYLTLFCRASSLCNTVQIFLKQNYPLILAYRVSSMGEIRFCLAPKCD